MIIYKHEYSPYDGEIRTYEINVEEKPKTYIVTKKYEGGWESRISKDAIGTLDGSYIIKTFSLSRDTKDFAKLLIAKTDERIIKLEAEIQKAQNEKKKLLKLL